MNYHNVYQQLIKNAQAKRRVKGTEYYEQHHILPRSMGGSNQSSNLVLLTAKEHYVAHHLLWRAHRNKSMALAFIKIRTGNAQQQTHGGYITAKEYEVIRKELSLHSEEQGYNSYVNKTGIHGLSKHQRQLQGKTSGSKAVLFQSGIYKLTSEERIAIGKKYGHLGGQIAHASGKLLECSKKAVKSGACAAAGKRSGTLAVNRNMMSVISKKSHELGKGKENSQKAAKAMREKAKIRFEESLINAGFNIGYHISKTDAKQHGIKQYYGAVCSKHPELEGRRFTSSSQCTECSAEKIRNKYKV